MCVVVCACVVARSDAVVGVCAQMSLRDAVLAWMVLRRVDACVVCWCYL